MAQMENEPGAMAAFEHATRNLLASSRVSPQAASAAAYAFLQCDGASVPSVQFIEEETRRDAAYWSDTATPVELECYFIAAGMRLAEIGTFNTSRQIKRLIASLWQKMSPDERSSFLEWVGRESSK